MGTSTLSNIGQSVFELEKRNADFFDSSVHPTSICIIFAPLKVDLPVCL